MADAPKVTRALVERVEEALSHRPLSIDGMSIKTSISLDDIEALVALGRAVLDAHGTLLDAEELFRDEADGYEASAKYCDDPTQLLREAATNSESAGDLARLRFCVQVEP